MGGKVIVLLDTVEHKWAISRVPMLIGRESLFNAFFETAWRPSSVPKSLELSNFTKH
jgi:hypothetical protein